MKKIALPGQENLPPNYFLDWSPYCLVILEMTNDQSRKYFAGRFSWIGRAIFLAISAPKTDDETNHDDANEVSNQVEDDE